MFGIAVAVDPLIVIPVPENVCVPVPTAVKVVALFVKLLAKLYVSLAPLPEEGSVQTAPLLRVTAPVKFIAREPPEVEPKFTVPEIFVAPRTVTLRDKLAMPLLLIVNAPIVGSAAEFVTLSVPPLLIVIEPAEVCVTFTSIVTACAIMTASPGNGTTCAVNVLPDCVWPALAVRVRCVLSVIKAMVLVIAPVPVVKMMLPTESSVVKEVPVPVTAVELVE